MFWELALSKKKSLMNKKKALEFISYYTNEKNLCYYDENVKFSRWKKLEYNATFNPICALAGADSGRLEIFGGVASIVSQTMDEILAIAESDGTILTETIKEEMIRADDGIWCTPSMLVDLRKKNFIEYEVIVGNPMRIAMESNLQASNLKMIYSLLSVVQKSLMETKGMITLPKKGQ